MVIKERFELMGMVICDYVFRKTYFLADQHTVVEFFSLVEERRTIFKNNPEENRFKLNTLKTALREISIDSFDESLVENLNEDEIVEKYHVTKDMKDILLQYESLFDAKPTDYQKDLRIK